MLKTYTLFFLLLTLAVAGLAQEQPSYANLADKHFERFEYARAAPLYEKMAASKQAKPEVMYRLAYCYDMMQEYEKSVHWYSKYMQLDTTHRNIWVRIGDLYKTLGRYDSARQAFYRYAKVGYNYSEVAEKIAGCDSAINWLKQPQAVALVNEALLNTPASDWGVATYRDKMVFTSEWTRKGILSKKEISRREYPRTGRPFLRLYQLDSNWHSLASGATQPVVSNISFRINHHKYHVGPAVFTRQGDTVYFTITQTNHDVKYSRVASGWKTATRHLGLYYSVKDAKGNWQEPVPFTYNNMQEYSVGAAALSQDGSILYFTSDMPGGAGKTDIWYCEKLPSGQWSRPRNCGTSINTPEEEAYPTIGPGNRLYFASTGHAGMGGLDIYAAEGSRDQWQQAVNLQPPFNSGYDDFYCTIDSATGYLSSNRPGGKGWDDIYSFRYTAPVPVTAKAATAAPQPVTPAIVADTPVITRQAPPQEITEEIAPGKKIRLEKGQSFVLENLYYDYNKSNIRPDAAEVLNRLAAILQRHPSLKIELSAHTDSRGSDQYNLVLSQKRAESAVAYLRSKGIAADRLQAKGYGETRLKNNCSNGVPCSEAAHQLNRRTEVLILQD